MLSILLWVFCVVVFIILMVLWDKKRQKKKYKSYVYSEGNQKELEVKKAIEKERSRMPPHSGGGM